MALLHVDLFSRSLKRMVPINVVLPVDKRQSFNENLISQKPYKTLYLLHGLMGNCTDWLMNTNIQRMAEDRNLAVVMPSGENSFYIDQTVSNNDYGQYNILGKN